MSLADKIISANNSGNDSPWGPLDEFGFPLRHKDALDYTVARIVIRNQGLCVSPHDGLIYDLDDRLNGLPQPLNETAEAIVSRSGFDSPFARGAKRVLVFDRLKELLPKADMDSIQVCDGLIFDGETKKLKSVPTREEMDARFRAMVALRNEERKKNQNENQ